MNRWFWGLAMLVLAVVVGCSEDPQSPSRPERPNFLVAYTPKYPNATTCPAGTNGVSEIILHGQDYYGQPSTAQHFYREWESVYRRSVEAEVYSYTDIGQLCRNLNKLVTWLIQDSGDGYIQNTQTSDGPQRAVLQFNGQHSGWTFYITNVWWAKDRLIGSAGPKQICCPIQTVAGVWSDSIFVGSFWNNPN